MLSELKLRETVSRFLQINPESLTAGTPLNGALSRSIGRARLDAALRSELGTWRSEIYTVRTYGELTSALCGGAVPESPAPKPVVSQEPGQSAVSEVATQRIGIDIESVKAMPDTDDFWQAPFYRAHFTPAEIAYSLLRTNPTQTFAGMWCAKEALKKAAQKWAGLDWLEIEILHDSLGRPYIRVQESEVGNSSLSISHTTDFAVAVVVIAC